MDYGAQNGHTKKKPRTLPWASRQRSTDREADTVGPDLPKVLSMLCQLTLRHERDLNCLHQQNTYILFLSTGQDSLMPQLLQASATWKKQQESHQASQSLRQCLTLNADPDPESHQSHGIQEGRSAMEVELTKQDHPTGLVLAFPQMGSHQEDPRVGLQGWQHHDERDDANTRTDLQADGETRSHHQVSCLAKQNQSGTSHTLEIGTGHEGPQTSHIADDFSKQQCVAAHPGSTQTTSPTPIQTGRRPYEAYPEEIDRVKYGCILSELTLVNDNVQCYVNATFLTIMWTHLMCGAFNMSSWDDATAIFLAILKDGEHAPLCLRASIGVCSMEPVERGTIHHSAGLWGVSALFSWVALQQTCCFDRQQKIPSSRYCGQS